jgi:hypothetical protein
VNAGDAAKLKSMGLHNMVTTQRSCSFMEEALLSIHWGQPAPNERGTI